MKQIGGEAVAARGVARGVPEVAEGGAEGAGERAGEDAAEDAGAAVNFRIGSTAVLGKPPEDHDLPLSKQSEEKKMYTRW